MEYINNAHKKLDIALKRIIKKRQIKPTRAKVANEAGYDGSYIKPQRSEWMDDLIVEIEVAREKFDKYKTKKTDKSKQHQEKIKTLNEKINNLEIALNESRARELLLIKKVRELELELQSKNSSKQTLSDLSINLPDWTKN